jgi:transcriptional regulator with XRE-family HTH domain
MNKLFSKRLKELRKEKKLSQEKFGELMNIHHRTISYYEAGERIPSPETLELFADFFDVSLDYLMGRTNIRNYQFYNDLISLENLSSEAQKEILGFLDYINHKYNEDQK